MLLETWLLIRRRGGHQAADRFWQTLRSSGPAVECVGPVDLEVAWRIGEAFPDQAFSVADRTSFALMERLGISRVASFDSHFAIYRYGPRHDRAFEILR